MRHLILVLIITVCSSLILLAQQQPGIRLDKFFPGRTNVPLAELISEIELKFDQIFDVK